MLTGFSTSPDATTLRARVEGPLPRQRRGHARGAGGGAGRRGRAGRAHGAGPRSGRPAPRASTVDETHVYNAARTGLSYANAKAEAEREALRICAQGLPVVIVNPAHVLGRGDTYRGSTELVRRFLRREIPVYVDGALCIVGAEDVARGHLLAEEHGVVGERYILGSRNFTYDRLFADLARLSGVDAGPPSSCRCTPPSLWPGPSRSHPAPRDHRRGDPRALPALVLSLDEGQARARLDHRPPRAAADRHHRLVPDPRPETRRSPRTNPWHYAPRASASTASPSLTRLFGD